MSQEAKKFSSKDILMSRLVLKFIGTATKYNMLFLIRLGKMHPSFAKLHHVLQQVHQGVVAPEQAVTKQEAQISPKVSDEVGGAVDEELLLHWKLILAKVDPGGQFNRQFEF